MLLLLLVLVVAVPLLLLSPHSHSDSARLLPGLGRLTPLRLGQGCAKQQAKGTAGAVVSSAHFGVDYTKGDGMPLLFVWVGWNAFGACQGLGWPFSTFFPTNLPHRSIIQVHTPRYGIEPHGPTYAGVYLLICSALYSRPPCALMYNQASH